MQLISGNIQQKLSAVYIGRALGELGYQRMRYGGVRGYIVVRRTGDEMDRVQKSMALEACPDG
jgi:hypothetical protein